MKEEIRNIPLERLQIPMFSELIQAFDRTIGSFKMKKVTIVSALTTKIEASQHFAGIAYFSKGAARELN